MNFKFITIFFMYILKQLKRNFTYLLCNYKISPEQQAIISQKENSLEKKFSVEKIKNLKFKISDFLKDEVVKKYLKDDLEEQIKEKLKNIKNDKNSQKRLSIIYDQLKIIKENWDYLEKENKNLEKQKKLKEQLTIARLRLYEEHLKAVEEAEELICKTLDICDWVEEAKKAVEKNFLEELQEKSWFKKMSLDNQSKIIDIYVKRENLKDEIKEAKKKLLSSETAQKSDKIKQEIDKNSSENIDIALKIDAMEKKILELNEQELILRKSISRIWEKIERQLSKEEIEKMKDISILEFLQKSLNERLRFVSEDNTTAEEIINWTKDEVEINFVFGNKFNRELYLKTTAWMVLPLEVRKVVVNWIEYSRNPNSLQWEFFNESGKRLIIKDWTKINIVEKISTEKLNNFKIKINKELDELKPKDELEKVIIKQALERWYPRDFVKKLFYEQIKKLWYKWKELKSFVEDQFVELDRLKWYYYNKYKENAIVDNKVTAKFIAYALKNLWQFDKYEGIAKIFDFSSEEIQEAKETIKYDKSLSYTGKLNIEDIDLSSINIDKNEIERIRKIKYFRPWSKDAIILFKIALKISNLPQDWANNSNLHTIMKKESGWKVGILNYLIKWMSIDEFKIRALNNNISNRVSSSWLWQLKLSNVDRLYPSWRNWIWDPIEEAIWFIRYIRERYWDPNVAWRMWGKIWTYVNTRTWKTMNKTFREWY